MDFFATGGFQQLFSDLDEHDSQNNSNDFYNFENLNTTTTTIAQSNENEIEEIQNNWISTNDVYCGSGSGSGCGSEEGELFGSQKDTISSYAYYEIITLAADKDRASDLEDNQLTETYSFQTSDWNNNSYHHHNNSNGNGNGNNNDDDELELNVNDKQLEHSLNLLLPIEDEESESNNDLNANYLITREMAEWEERFLDNYIEIPELIEFLPEKTPLCTDECELFLHESTKNLKLHRSKRKQTATTNCDGTKTGYTCSFGNCRKIYAKPAHLKAHLRRHLGEKPYVCNWPNCTWKFSRSDELARHRRSHSGVKPYKCEFCHKCFARSDHLTKHRKVHERRLLAASKAGKVLDATALPYSILTVRPGRKRKNQIC